MNDDQVKLLDKIIERLGEHFDGYLLVVNQACRMGPLESGARQTTSVHYHGGLDASVGMARRAQLYLEEEMIDALATPADDDEDDEMRFG